MQLGLQIPRFHWAGNPVALAPTLARIAATADQAGFSSLWLMDHFFQLASMGKVDEEMLEAYTTLGFLAVHTRRARLGTLVTGVHYRQPGILIKQVTSLDVLSGGRAWLGIGAGWYEREARGLGASFPPRTVRFELLEETLKLAHHMWRGQTGPLYQPHVHAAEPLCAPPPISQPHPPILIGGGGERKTLRLVARYADACNFFARLGNAALVHKLEVLQHHCDQEGRAYDSIQKSVLTQWNLARQSPAAIVDALGAWRELGFDLVIGSLVQVERIEPLERLAQAVIPQVAGL